MMRNALSGIVAGSAVVSCILAAPVASAQEYQLGLSGGATYATLSGDLLEPDASEGKWGLLFGGFVGYTTHPIVSARMEVNWVQKGGTGVTATAADSIDLRLSYLEIPVVLELGTSFGRRVHGGLYGGIALGFRLSCDLGVNGTTGVSCHDAPMPLDLRSTEWSVPLGATLGLDVGGPVLYLDGRYSISISNVSKGSATSVKSRVWELIMRVGFPLM
jgi:hypothetical protein